MQFRVIKPTGQKVVHEASAAELCKHTGKLTLWNLADEGLPCAEVVASYESHEWQTLQRYNGEAVKPCNCGH